MPSPDAMLAALRRLNRNINVTEKPDVSELADLAQDWCELLDDLDDEQLALGVREYLRGPVPFWPTPGQLRDLALGTTPAQVQGNLRERLARGRQLFAVVCRARSSSGERGDPVRYLRFYGVTDDVELGAVLGAVAEVAGHWRHFEAGDPARGANQRDHDWACKRFAEAYAATAADPARAVALLPPPPEERPRLAVVAVDDGVTPFPADRQVTMADFTPAEAAWLDELCTTSGPFLVPAPTERMAERYGYRVEYRNRSIAEAATPARPAVSYRPALPPQRRFRDMHVGLGWCSPDQVGHPIPEGFVPPTVARRGAAGEA